jgi:DNA-binding transcriptional LysR family regulator
MNLERLRTFRALAETLHFRRTAERLRISQSAVSQQIALLEKEMGTPLLERIGRRVYLTDAGRALADECSKVLAVEKLNRLFKNADLALDLAVLELLIATPSQLDKQLAHPFKRA